MYLDRRIFDSYVHEIWLPFIESKRKMVHFMSLATVKAESIENERIRTQLKAIGVNYAQDTKQGNRGR